MKKINHNQNKQQKPLLNHQAKINDESVVLKQFRLENKNDASLFLNETKQLGKFDVSFFSFDVRRSLNTLLSFDSSVLAW